MISASATINSKKIFKEFECSILHEVPNTTGDFYNCIFDLLLGFSIKDIIPNCLYSGNHCSATENLTYDATICEEVKHFLKDVFSTLVRFLVFVPTKNLGK